MRARRGEFDVVVCCYHDQGLIPVKLVAFGHAVNVTLGLPFVRTSVDHGTAFDIAASALPTRKAWWRRFCWPRSLAAVPSKLTPELATTEDTEDTAGEDSFTESRPVAIAG